jgi:hypothetical protein
MAEVQLLGMTHYPPFAWADGYMAGIMNAILNDPGIPAREKDPAAWPAPMRAEWGDDRGRTAASAHRADMIAGLDRVRGELERFDPDVVLVWGDDQYENFREDLIPPFSILAYPDRVIDQYETPVGKFAPSYWDEPKDRKLLVRGRPDIGRWLAGELLKSDFDVSYAYQPLHDEFLPHSFLNTVLFLDHRRTGFTWPMICFPINCYGRKIVAAHGAWKPIGTGLELDPPSPSPRRLMSLGARVARLLRDSPWRVSVIASSSWSHAFLTDHTWRLRPDTDADRVLYGHLVNGDYDEWEKLTLDDVEKAGQQELLNWCAIVGAARELGVKPQWTKFVDTWIFNSNKVFAVWDVA